jgi:putative methyltransferase (TIGR04325 family)
MKILAEDFKRLFRRSRRAQNIAFDGDYTSWESAAQNSAGYDSEIILKKSCDALLRVKNGAAAYERDSVLFDKIEHSFPVLAGLLRAAQANGGSLCVVDFGGALGTSFFQCRSFLATVKKLEWLVVEQKSHVTCGRKYFASEQLHFHNTIDECVAGYRPNALLASSVLQYLPQPYETLKELFGHRISHVIFDRTPFLSSGRERLTVQHVPESIYPASYPAWFFNESKFIGAATSTGYTLVADFPGADNYSPEGEKAYFKGFIFERRDT